MSRLVVMIVALSLAMVLGAHARAAGTADAAMPSFAVQSPQQAQAGLAAASGPVAMIVRTAGETQTKPRCPACPKRTKPGSCKADCPPSPAMATGSGTDDWPVRREWRATAQHALFSKALEPELPPPRA